MRDFYRRGLSGCIVCLIMTGASLAQLQAQAQTQAFTLPGVSDVEQQQRINNIYQEFSTSQPGQAGSLVPAFLETLTGLNQAALYQVYNHFLKVLNVPSVQDAMVQALKTNRAEIASVLLVDCANNGDGLELSAAQTQAIISMLSCDNQNVRCNLAQILSNVSSPGDNKVREALIRLLASDEQAQVRVAAANALSKMGRDVYFKNAPPIAAAFGKAVTEDVSPHVRSAAASGLAQMQGKAESASEALIKALSDNSFLVRQRVLQAIINIGPPCRGCIDELIDMFKGQSDIYGGPTRELIVQAFGAIGSDAARAVPVIVPLLEDKKSAGNAARALASIGPEAAPAVPGLMKLLDSPFYNDRCAAARALKAVGPQAKPALPALRKASADERNAEGYGNAAQAKQAAREAILELKGEL